MIMRPLKPHPPSSSDALANLMQHIFGIQCTIHRLPNEILIPILHQLDSPSLKNARQVCHRWAEAGAGGLFKRIYFAPHHKVMELFTNITSVPAFAKTVTELVYDIRMFWSFWEQPRAHEIAFIEAGAVQEYNDRYSTDNGHLDIVATTARRLAMEGAPVSLQATETKSLERYSELLAQQEAILDQGLDYKSLCQGLKKLPNLKALSVLRDFDKDGDWTLLHDPPGLWYERWAADIWKDTVSPTSWSDCYEMEVEDEDVDGDDDDPFDYALEDLLVNFPWDWRGFSNCMKAVALHSNGLEHLHLGSQVSKLPLDILAESMASRMMIIAKGLKCLKIGR